jgi:hypothetical protein
MSLVKTWTFSLNVTPTDTTSVTTVQKSFLMQLMTFLIANGWTADGSCNSTATHATTNLSVYTDWVAAAEGSAHSWQILKSPAGIVAGRDGSYTGDQSCIWMILSTNSAQAGTVAINFTTVKPTGGTTTATPNDTTTSVGWAAGSSIYRNSGSTSAVFQFAVTSTGQFWAGITCPGVNKMIFFMAVFPTGTPAQVWGHDHPYCIAVFKSYHDTAITPILSDFNTTNYKVWTEFGLVVSAPTLMVYAYSIGGIGYNNTSGLTRLNVSESSIGYIYSPSGGGFIGSIVDFEFHGCANLPNGVLDAATPTKCNAYNIWVPVNGALTY